MLIVLVIPIVSSAYDDQDTHPRLTRLAFRNSSIDAVLKIELGLPDGAATALEEFPPVFWAELGATHEDSISFCNASNHFHNALKPFPAAAVSDVAGVSRICSRPPQSSVVWGTRFRSPTDKGPAVGNVYDWDSTRFSYLKALTLESTDERQEALADTFFSLGHVMHLIQDLAQPAHVRNDLASHFRPFPEFPVTSTADLLRWAASPFEKFVSRTPQLVDNAGSIRPSMLGRSLPGFWDIDFYDGTNPSDDPGAALGLAEWVNANFASDFTILTETLNPADRHYFPYPRRSSTNLNDLFSENMAIVHDVTAPDTKTDTTIHISKTDDGEIIQNFAHVSYFWRDVNLVAPGTWPGLFLQLDDVAHADHARHLLPRAIGYSAAVVDYFFRGRLDVDLADGDGGLVLVGRNAADDALGAGTLRLYADGVGSREGMRFPASAETAVDGVATGDPLPVVPVTLPPEAAGAERFVAVYTGALGAERPEGGTIGAVIGKVLGGVRVEEIFANSSAWMVRTPRGVFALTKDGLPLTTAQYPVVKWGDDESQLIARSPLTSAGATITVFRVPRKSSSDFDTPLDSTTIALSTVKTVPFPSGPVASAVVTSVNYRQSVTYREHFARSTRTTTFRWVPDPPPNTDPSQGTYVFAGSDFGPFAFALEYEQTIPFAQNFAVRLDLAHNADVTRFPPPYAWRLKDMYVSATGRVLGLAVVFLTIPEIAFATVPVHRLNQSGALEQSRTQTIGPYFPEATSPLLWALFDLETGAVVASTAGPVITHVSEDAIDDLPQGQVNSAFWAESVAVYTGGRDDRTEHQGWVGVASTNPTPFGGTIGQTTGSFALPSAGAQSRSFTGWLRADLGEAMTARGLTDVSPDMRPGPCRTARVQGDRDQPHGRLRT
ncbi:MAG: hypothetical protein DMD78_29130 [Candidatus Rokuibacteriota bacterium]|nr:MAG: hypothetical protein DMD78_29130 [Candidatus Rokubacteria bacterium]